MSSVAAEHVRAQARSAFIGAGLMLFFGYGYLSEPSGTDLFSRASWVFIQTLRIGGLAMAAAGAALLSGHRLALAADALLAGAVGLLLMGTGVVMFVDGGDVVQSAINVVCGYALLSSGLHSGRLFVAARGMTRPGLEPLKADAGAEARATLARPGQRPPPHATPTGSQSSVKPSPRSSGDVEGASRMDVKPPATSRPPTDSNRQDDTPSGGYLAALADENTPRRGEHPV